MTNVLSWKINPTTPPIKLNNSRIKLIHKTETPNTSVSNKKLSIYISIEELVFATQNVERFSSFAHSPAHLA